MRYPMLALSLLALLAACKPGEPTPAERETEVRAKAEARWEAVLAKDYDKAYTYLSPGFRSRVSIEKYRGRFMGGKTKWLEARVTGVECDGDSCTVKLDTRYLFTGVPPFPPQEVETQDEEKWVYTQDAWWLVPRR